MRRHGTLGTVSDLGVHDHGCWLYRGDAELRHAVVEYLTDGRRLGQRLFYVGGKPEAGLRADIDGLEAVEPLLRDGGLRVAPIPALYRPGEPIDPEDQLAIFADATEEALADGYTGLRVAAEVTTLVTEPETWSAHTRWESLADRYMASHPLSALCLYDRDAIPERALSDLAAVHPAAHAPAAMVPFRVYSDPDALMLEGEVDYFSTEALRRVLAAAPRNGSQTVLDLSRLEFIDHHGLLALADHARSFDSGSGGMAIRGAPFWVKRLCQLIDIEL
jgi:ABC-type transporter Mla MlaB component